jgi:hypothetical protein
MKTRWALCAITALTALIAANDLFSAIRLSDGLSKHATGAWASTVTSWALEHQRFIVITKPAVSALMLVWWLAATIKPTRRPSLRLANAAFSGWLLSQELMVWAAVVGVLQQVSGLPGGLTARNALTIIEGTDLRWLIPLTLCLPALQLGLGEWAHRLSSPSRQTQGDRTIASAGAG